MNASPTLEKATFGAGCFWGVEAEVTFARGIIDAVAFEAVLCEERADFSGEIDFGTDLPPRVEGEECQ